MTSTVLSNEKHREKLFLGFLVTPACSDPDVKNAIKAIKNKYNVMAHRTRLCFAVNIRPFLMMRTAYGFFDSSYPKFF